MKNQPRKDAGQDTLVIRGGCPDGFWVRFNCDKAAELGLCSMVTRIDNRPASLRSESEGEME